MQVVISLAKKVNISPSSLRTCPFHYPYVCELCISILYYNLPFQTYICLTGTGGCLVTKTTKTLIIAVYESPISATDCVVEVERFADYFISMQL